VSIVTARLKSATFVLDSTDHSAQIVDVTLTAEGSGGGSDRRTLSGELVPETETYADTLNGTVIQDWPAPGGGLIGHTRAVANRGKVVPFTLTSVDPAGYVATGTVKMSPLDLGLNPNETAEAALSWKIVTLDETYPAGP
jgi:hypothetical protein